MSDTVHPPHDRRPADLRPDLRLDRAARRPTAPVVLAWGSREPAPGRDRRPEAAATRQHPVLPAGRHGGQRQDHVPRRPAPLERSSTPTRRSSARTRTASTSARASATIAYRPIAVRRARSTPTELAIGMNFGGDMAVDPASQRRSSRCRRSRRAVPGPADGRLRPGRLRRPARGRAVRPVSTSDWVRLPHLPAGSRYAVADAGALRRPEPRARVAGPLRQRPERRRRLQLRPRRSTGTSE